jgi:tetratricopeptide (TPR) repeat protein
MDQQGKTFHTDPNAPISFALLKGYIQNTLTKEEKAIVENAIQNDPFVADALDGLKSSKDIEKTADTIQGIQSTINQKTRKKQTRKIFALSPRIAIAASLVLLLGITGLFYYNAQNKSNSDQVFAEHFEKYELRKENKKNTSSSSKDETAVQSDDNINVSGVATNDGYSQPKDQFSPSEVTEPLPVLDVPQDNVVPDLEIEEKDVENEEIVEMGPDENIVAESMADSISTNRGISAQDGSKSISLSPAPEITEIHVEKTSAYKTNRKTKFNNDIDISGLVKNAENFYNQDNYSEAATKYDEILKLDPDNTNALFYLGQCKLELQQPKEALQNFNAVLKQPANIFTEAAQWYKALSLIKMNKINKAKKELQQIMQNQGEYAKRADELLKSL